MAPVNKNVIYSSTALFFIIVQIPAIAPALVPGPVIIKARRTPPLAPPFIKESRIGIEADPLTYRGNPKIAARGTAKMFFAPNKDKIKAEGTNLLIKYPTAAKREK